MYVGIVAGFLKFFLMRFRFCYLDVSLQDSQVPPPAPKSPPPAPKSPSAAAAVEKDALPESGY